MTSIEETPAEKRKRLAKRDKYRSTVCRSTVCRGCRHNYYNYPKPQSERGDVAVPDDYSCWFIGCIKRSKCPQHS